MTELAFRTLLANEPTISALVGDRIMPMVLDEDPKFPAVTYQVISDIVDPSFETDGLQRMRLQVDCWSKRYQEAAIVRGAIRDFVGSFAGQLSDGTFVSYAEPSNKIDFFEQEPMHHRLMLEVYLYYTPAPAA